MRLKFVLSYSIIALVIFGMIAISKVNAQSGSSILVGIVPSNPAPYENTSITLSSFADDLDSVNITWSVDGKNVSSGIGKKSFSLNAPAAGSVTSVKAVLSLPSGSIETNMTIRPSVMVLLWQANDSYAPPFYRGKALPTPDSQIKVVAMPEIRTTSGLANPKNMTYAWRKDYNNEVDASGYGKNFFVYISDYLENSNNVEVTASVNQNYSSDSSIDIGMTQPKILFYKNDSNIGTIWEHSLSSPHRIEGPEVVEAVPYFISPKQIQNPRLVWSWSINDTLVDTLDYKKNVIPLRVEEGTSGISKLKLNIENRDKIFQTASKEINVEF